MRRTISHIAALLLCVGDAFGQPSASVSKASLDFGIARVRRAVSDTLVVGNVGASDLVVDRVELGATVFALPATSVTASFTLRAGESRSVAVQFTPPSAGAFSDTFQVRSNAPTVRVPVSGRGVRSTVVIDEVLADPATGAEGDANGDGVRDSFQDEFVEILNIGSRPEAIGGWRLSDDDTVVGSQFIFPPGRILAPGARAVLFGGGTPAGIPGSVFTDDGRIGNGLTNTGESVLLIDPAGPDTLDAVTFGGEGDRDQSLVRYPEGIGSFALHGDLPGDGTKFSPGRARVVMTSITVAPADTGVAVGDSVAWRATGFFGDGRSRDVTLAAAWGSTDSAVVKVNAGRGKAERAGTAEVRANVGGVGGPTARLTVRAPEPTGLIITPSETTVVAGGSVFYRAEAVLPGGTHQAASGLVWTVSDGGVAAVTGPGSLQGRGAGETAVRASDGRVTSPPAALRVVRKGDLNGTAGVEVADALRLIDLILEVSPPPTPLERAAADLNGDGRIDVADLTAIIDVMLGRVGPPANKPADGEIAFEIRAGERDGSSELVIDGPVSVEAVQVDMMGGPKGLALVGSAEGMALTSSEIDGRTRAVIYSLSGRRIPASGGAILRFWGGAVDRVVVAWAGRQAEAVRSGVEGAGTSGGFGLGQSFPNPANAGVVIRYDLPEAQEVTLDLFDLLGRRVVRLAGGRQYAGKHLLQWNGRDEAGRPVGSGVYLYRLAAGRFVDVKKMVWVK